MKPAAAFSLAIVCEGPDDLRTAPSLADRVLVEEVDWIEGHSLSHHRAWRGFSNAETHLEWRHTRALAEERQLKTHGNFSGLPDARAGRRALLLLAMASERPDAILLVRDTDGDERRREGLDLARREARPGKPWPFPVILGVAHCKRECWVLAGFDPQNREETEALAAVRQQLGFDPRMRAEELTAREEGALRDAKRVAGELLRDREREEMCWMTTDLSVLSDRGKNTGLADFLQEVRERLVPLFGPGVQR